MNNFKATCVCVCVCYQQSWWASASSFFRLIIIIDDARSCKIKYIHSKCIWAKYVQMLSWMRGKSFLLMHELRYYATLYCAHIFCIVAAYEAARFGQTTCAQIRIFAIWIYRNMWDGYYYLHMVHTLTYNIKMRAHILFKFIILWFVICGEIQM